MLLAVLTVLALVLLAAWAAQRYADRFTIGQARPLVSGVDGLPYRVHVAHSEPQRAADTLARLNARTVGLLRHLRAAYVRGAAGLARPARRRAAERLLARYSPDSLAENSPFDRAKDTSYTVDKGATVALCLRERGGAGDALHGLDTLTFVTFHEMAHIAVEEVDHPPRFWAAFRFLLEAAEEGGVYRSPDYAARPVRYCGLRVDYNPRYDPAVAPL